MRIRANGPTTTSESRRLALITQCASTTTSSPKTESCTTLPVLTMHRAPILVFPRGHIRIDQHRFRQLDGHTVAHQGLALPVAKRVIHSCQVRARVATQHLP